MISREPVSTHAQPVQWLYYNIKSWFKLEKFIISACYKYPTISSLDEKKKPKKVFLDLSSNHKYSDFQSCFYRNSPGNQKENASSISLHSLSDTDVMYRSGASHNHRRPEASPFQKRYRRFLQFSVFGCDFLLRRLCQQPVFLFE